MTKYYLFTIITFLLLTTSCKKGADNQLSNTKSDSITQPKRSLNLRDALQIDSTFLGRYQPKIIQFYNEHQNKTVWNNQKDRVEFLSFLELIDEDGLDKNDYYFDKLKTKEANFNDLNELAHIELDILYTQSFFRVANNLHSGKLNPRTLYNDWEVTPEKLEPEKLLFNSLYEHKITHTLDSLRPNNIIYNKLKTALSKEKQLPEEPEIMQQQIKINKKIQVNDTVNSIIDIKKKLAHLKFYTLEDSITSVYNVELEEAVKKFQKRNNLTADGVIGAGTIKSLNYNRMQRKAQIVANLERLRWYPRYLGENYVLVNIAGFELWAVAKGDTIHHHRVVVGKNSRRTPILSSKFSDIVFNPTWTVPPTIIKNDLTPSATKNRGYFANNRIKIYKNGAQVSAEDWNPEVASSYRYVQDPGSHNSLGLIKFNFPNNYMVYLHDTNNRSVFGRDGRDLSSGCIRVESPVSLAAKIFKMDQNETMNEEKINSLIAKGKTTSIKIKSPIYVHQFYWTVSVAKDGGLKFNADIYNLDEGLYAALRK